MSDDLKKPDYDRMRRVAEEIDDFVHSVSTRDDISEREKMYALIRLVAVRLALFSEEGRIAMVAKTQELLHYLVMEFTNGSTEPCEKRPVS